MIVKGSQIKAGVGRILHVYGPGWHGPRPGLVVNPAGDVEIVVVKHRRAEDGAFVEDENGQRIEEARESAGHTQAVNVNVALDGFADEVALSHCRREPSGNTLRDVPVFASLNDEQREWLRTYAPNGAWAEWPPRD